jgi:hypothetical protein
MSILEKQHCTDCIPKSKKGKKSVVSFSNGEVKEEFLSPMNNSAGTSN